jgi:hypothetical protein
LGEEDELEVVELVNEEEGDFEGEDEIEGEG